LGTPPLALYKLQLSFQPTAHHFFFTFDPCPQPTTVAESSSSTQTIGFYPIKLKDTIVALEETYPDLEITPATKDFEQFAGTAVDAIFFCLDFLVRVKLQTLQTEGFQILLWYQAEDREFEKHEPIFHAVSTSMMQSVS